MSETKYTELAAASGKQLGVNQRGSQQLREDWASAWAGLGTSQTKHIKPSFPEDVMSQLSQK